MLINFDNFLLSKKSTQSPFGIISWETKIPKENNVAETERMKKLIFEIKLPKYREDNWKF